MRTVHGTQTLPRRSIAARPDLWSAGRGFGRIGFEPRSRIVPFDSPELAILKVFQQFTILNFAHITRPHDLGRIDGCSVPIPFTIEILIRSVTHEHKLLSGPPFQLAHH